MVTAANPYRDQRTQYDPGMGMDELCDALNLGKYIGVLAPSGGEPTISSAIISFLQSGTPASGTVAHKLRQIISVTDEPFGAVGDGVTDDTAAIQAAIDHQTNGGVVFFPPGDYLISTVLTAADPDKLTLLGCGRFSRIHKGANMTMISLGAESSMHRLYLDGEGGTYTGLGVSISTGANDNVSWRRITECDIIDTKSYCVEFTQAIAGFKSVLLNSRFVPTDLATVAIKMPAADETNGNRKIIACDSASNTLVDLGGSENTHVLGCDGSVPLFDDLTTKAICTGNRFVGSEFTFDGTDCVFTSNVLAPTTWTFNATLAGSVFRNNSFATSPTITDNAGGSTSGNEIEYNWVTYTPTWTATGTAPAIGDGTINGAYHREGTDMHVNIVFTAGSTTTFGTGAWSFSLPKAADRLTVGAARLTDSGTAFYAAVCEIAAAASTVQIYGYNVANAVTNAIPFTWASGDRITLDIVYPIDG